MPLCWIFLLKRRRALSNVSFSPTRTSANRCSPPPARVSGWFVSRRAADRPGPVLDGGRQSRRSLPEGLRLGQTVLPCRENGPAVPRERPICPRCPPDVRPGERQATYWTARL